MAVFITDIEVLAEADREERDNEWLRERERECEDLRAAEFDSDGIALPSLKASS